MEAIWTGDEQLLEMLWWWWSRFIRNLFLYFIILIK
jgi:hypothetical protein